MRRGADEPSERAGAGSISPTEGLFVACLDAEGRLDPQRFDRACASHPELTPELVEMRRSFERGAKLVGRNPFASVEVPSSLGPGGSAAEASSADGNREAERLFHAAVRAQDPERAPDIESLCRVHPQRASELRLLHASWRKARTALGSDALRPGGTAARYRVLGEIAEGGMGAIFAVWDTSLGRSLAMKTLKRGEANERERAFRERARLRLRHEAEILGRLQHPSIVPVHEVGELEDGDPYFTMLKVEGLALSEILPRIASGADGWTLPRAIRVLLQVCEAVAHAHSQGIVHRDLKPANVMVGPFGETYVMDWGLAKAHGFPGEADVRVREGAAAPASADLGTARVRHATPLLTLEGDVLGTPAYMAPEQARGRIDEVGPRSDVYSAGAILYHLLAGAAPYDAGGGDTSPRRVLERVLAGPPALLARRALHAPPELVAIADKAMARDPRERYATMLELAEDLRAWLEVRVVRAHARGAWAELTKWMQRHRAVVGLLAALLVLVVGSAVSLAVLGSKAAERSRQAARAQFDALRRLNALRPLAPSGGNLPSFRDDFEDGFLDRRWVITGRTDLASERDGRLRLEASADAEMNTEVILDPYVNVIRGDFDASVDFSLEDFTVPTVELGEHVAGLAVDLADGGTMVLEIDRKVECKSRFTPGVEHSYQVASGLDSLRVFVEGADLEGRLRLARVGKRLSAYYWRDGWQELASKDYTAAPLRLRFNARNWYAKEPFAVEFDDLEIRTSFEKPSQTLKELRDDFSDGALDSRLVIRADAGIPAELEGRLYLEKLQGLRGHVGLDLSDWNWVLRGDFSVSFSLELMDFPRSDDGETYLALLISGTSAPSLGEIQVLATPEGRSYRFLRHWADVREPMEGSTGRLRVERRGQRLSFQYWLDGWRELSGYTLADAELDLFFRVVLQSSSDESVVVAIDDLEATSMIRRADVAPVNPTIEDVSLRRSDGPAAGARLAGVCALGDIDRDGVQDFAVSASGDTEAGKQAGLVWVRSGRDFAVLARFQGQESETFGLGLAGAGDVDADGHPDVVVGAPGLKASAPEYVRVFSGRHIAAGTGPSELRTWSIGSTEDDYGLDVAGLGDVDGDGCDDVFVGARARNQGRGTAFVYSGRDGSELFRLEGEQEKAGMGSDGAGLGDLDGDGCADFAVGAFLSDSSGRVDVGRVYVLLGGAPGRIGRPLYPPLEGERRSEVFGVSLASAGDVDCDGAADLVVGACGQFEAGATPGRIYLYSGRSGRRLWSARGRSVGDYFGRSIASAGDVNGDGLADVLAGARFNCNRGRGSGMIRVFSGRDGAVLATFDGVAEGDGFGISVSGLDDIDGDGLADSLASAPGTDPGGRVDAGSVYLIPGKSCTRALGD